MAPTSSAPASGQRSRAHRGLGSLLVVISCAMLASHCATRHGRVRPAPADPSSDELVLRVQTLDEGPPRVRAVSLTEYVAGTVLAEMPIATLAPEVALPVARVQAILARTYALRSLGRHAGEGFDLCATTHCQLYKPAGRAPAAARAIAQRAVESTHGLVLAHEGRPIEALYHADCAGRTSAAASVWGGATPPYLRGVVDEVCARESRAVWHFEVGNAALRAALNADPSTRIGDTLERVEALRRDPAGRVTLALIEGERRLVVRGEQLRAAVMRQFGGQSLKSTRFEVARDGGAFVFTGLGVGHGVGLCQTGAIARVRRGQPAGAILDHYYPGAQLVSLPAGLKTGATARRPRSLLAGLKTRPTGPDHW